MPRISLLLLAVLLATPSFAAEDPLAFGKGPVKWLMTREEEQAWRAVKTAEQARDFVDLFWVRRDPTPGTLQNEFRDEVADRIAFADRIFKEGKTRGAMTERGRVYVLLGKPSNMSNEGKRYLKQSADDNQMFGGRQYAAKDTWIWEHKDALRYEMPKIEVVFLMDDAKGVSHRDPHRGDFIAAFPKAIQKPIVSPELTEVPAWARPQLITAPSNVVLRVVTTETVPSQTTTTTSTVVVPAPAPTVRARSAGNLTLVKDAFALNAQGRQDPFSGVTSIETFKPGDELNFVAEYCAGVITEELAGVTVQAKITGMINGEKINMNGPADELIPDSIKVSPGCHLVRGAVPLEGVDPGLYTMTLTIAAGADKYNLTREFRVE